MVSIMKLFIKQFLGLIGSQKGDFSFFQNAFSGLHTIKQLISKVLKISISKINPRYLLTETSHFRQRIYKGLFLQTCRN